MQAVFGTGLHTSVPVGSGSIVAEPQAAVYPYGALVRLTALPQASNYFGFWANAGSASDVQEFVVANANPAIAVVFYALTAGQSSLTVLPQGYGRVMVNPLHSHYSSSQNVTLSAIPDSGQTFTGWGGSANGATNPLVLNMSESKVITASFTKSPHLAAAK